jgi:hypothetical protein
MTDIFQRKGVFKITSEMLRTDVDAFRKIQKDVIIVRADNCFLTNTITYYCYSEFFDEISFGQILPEYEVMVHDNEVVEWKRK